MQLIYYIAKPSIGSFVDSERVLLLPNEKQKKLRFKKLFGNKNPVKMEICSGSGEWIVERAESDPNINWVNYQIIKNLSERFLLK